MQPSHAWNQRLTVSREAKICHIIQGFSAIGNIRPKLLDVTYWLIVEALLLGPF